MTFLVDSLLSRNSPVQQLGQFRGLLNQYRMKGVITEYHFETSENTKEQGSFKSTVTCSLTSGEEAVGDSVNYYTGKKGISEEMAAKNALAKIEQFIKSSSSDHTVTMTSTNPPSVSNVTMPKSLFVGPTGSTSPTSTAAKVYKQFLHNLLVQKLRQEIPKYDTKRDEQGNFQCTISHQLFGSITGSKFPNKKDAENSAAWRAWSKLKNYH